MHLFFHIINDHLCVAGGMDTALSDTGHLLGRRQTLTNNLTALDNLAQWIKPTD